MNNRKGECINFGNDCPVADHKQTVELSVTEDFVCPECGNSLIEKAPPPPPPTKKILTIVAILAVLGGIGFGGYKLFSCDTSNVSVTITSKNPSVAVGKTEKLAVVTEPKCAGKKITWKWTSSNEDIAAVNSKGVVTGKSVGETTIVATSQDDPQITSTVTVIVRSTGSDEERVGKISVESVSVNPSTLSLRVNNNRTLAATVVPANAGKELLWSSSNESVATVNNGTVTAVSVGNADITVKSADDNTKSAVCRVTVTAEPPQRTPLTCGNTTLTFPFGSYQGPTKYDAGLHKCLPEGRGVMTYTRRVRIAKHGSATIYAEAGDSFRGEWGNGDIVSGLLYDSDGNQKVIDGVPVSINVSKRTNPYDLSND